MIPRAALLLVSCAACGGGMPLLYGAHAVPRHDVTFGAGFSGAVLPASLSASGSAEDGDLFESALLAPGLAPWLGGRLGLGGGFDAGLTYSGRSVRLDGRRSFELSPATALSLGLGASGLLPRRFDELGLKVGGFSGELPLLLGWRSRADIYTVWIGARGGAELIRGQHERVVAPDLVLVEPVGGFRAWTGGVAGLRIGLGHLFALLELDVQMNWAGGDIGSRSVSLQQLGVAPAGALVARF